MLNMTVELTKMLYTETHFREINGQMEECISIPIRINGLDKFGKDRVFLNMYLFKRNPNNKNVNYYASIRYRDKNLRQKVIDMGYKNNISYIGSIWFNYFFKRSRFAQNKNEVSLDDALNIDK